MRREGCVAHTSCKYADQAMQLGLLERLSAVIKNHKGEERSGAFLLWGDASRAWLVWRRLRGDLINAYKNLADAKRMVPDSFQWCPETRQGQKNTRNSTSTQGRTSSIEGSKALEQLPREGVEFSPLEEPQTHLGVVPYHLLQVTLLWQRVGLGDLQRSIPTPPILWLSTRQGKRSFQVQQVQIILNLLSPWAWWKTLTRESCGKHGRKSSTKCWWVEP